MSTVLLSCIMELIQRLSANAGVAHPLGDVGDPPDNEGSGVESSS